MNTGFNMNKALKKRGKFALIAHPSDVALFRKYIKYLKPEKTYKDAFLMKLFEWAPSYKVKEWENYSLDGEHYSNGAMYMVPFLPEMREINLREVKSKVEQAIALAAGESCTVAAMGAFTSILFQGEEEVLEKKYGIRITSGNTMTAALIVQSVNQLAEHLLFSLPSKTIAIIGASGDIGSGCMLYWGDKVKKLILTARGLKPIAQLIKDNPQCFHCETEITKDNNKAIEEADIIVFVTSAYTHLYNIADFKPGKIICDASVPLNVKTASEIRRDTLLYHGGIAEIADDFDVGFDIGLPTSNALFGCLTEGILLSQHPDLPFSQGRGKIKPGEIDRFVITLGKKIKVLFSSGSRAFSDEEIARYARYINK